MTYLLIYLLLGLPVAIYAANETRRGYLGLLWIPVAWVGWWIVLAALLWLALLNIKRKSKCAFCGYEWDGDNDEMRAHIASCEKHPLREMAREMEAK